MAGKKPKIAANQRRGAPACSEEEVPLVQRGVTRDGYVVYGSPAKPKHTTVERIYEAVHALKNQQTTKLKHEDGKTLCGTLQQKATSAGLPFNSRSSCAAPYREEVTAMNERPYGSIWDAIENSPSNAASLRLKSALMMALKNAVANSASDQAAARLCVTQSRLNELMQGKIERFDFDALVNMATAAGLHVKLRISDKR